LGAVDGNDIITPLSLAIGSNANTINVNGNYLLGYESIEVTRDIEINFNGIVTLLNGARPNLYVQEQSLTPTQLPNYRGTTITVSDASEVSQGDSIFINTTTVGETDWNYTRQFQTTVTSIDGNVITFSRPSTFNFNKSDITGLTVTFSKRKTVTVNNLKINTENCSEGDGLNFTSLCVNVFNNEQFNGDSGYTLRLNRCYDILMNNMCFMAAHIQCY